MGRCVGLDIHKRVVQVCILDPAGQVQAQTRLDCTLEALGAFAQAHLQRTDRIALEATTNTWSIVALLRPFVAEVVVSNPLRTQAIAQAKVKTDKVDARVLAELLRVGYLPEVWQPDPATQQIRQLTSRRAGLVADRTTVKNRIHALLHVRLIPTPGTDLFSRQGLAWLKALPLDDLGRAALESELRLLAAMEQELQAMDALITRYAWPDPRVKLLMTLPGIDVRTAQALLAAVGELARFPDADHLAAYLGLVPSTRQSAHKAFHGPITKHGNAHARWLLVQAAQSLARHPGPLGAFFQRLARRKNRHVAIVACARKLATLAFHVLRNQEPYRYAKPTTTRVKLSRFRVRASGQKRPTSLPTGIGAIASARRIPALNELYAAESLPPARTPDQLPAGELNTLRRSGTLAFARSVHTPHRVAGPTQAAAVQPQEAEEVQQGA